MLAPYNFFLYESEEYTNTYEFLVEYMVDGICINELNQNDYFLGNGIGFIKGIDINTNSYEIWHVFCVEEELPRTVIVLEVTVLKNLANSYNYPDNDENIELLFSRDTALYILYPLDTGSIEYFEGYVRGNNEGYDSGYDSGYHDGYGEGLLDGVMQAEPEAYQEGYNNGYNIGYDDGLKSTLGTFTENFHVWFVPAIILVFAIGIFITYRRGRE